MGSEAIWNLQKNPWIFFVFDLKNRWKPWIKTLRSSIRLWGVPTFVSRVSLRYTMWEPTKMRWSPIRTEPGSHSWSQSGNNIFFAPNFAVTGDWSTCRPYKHRRAISRSRPRSTSEHVSGPQKWHTPSWVPGGCRRSEDLGEVGMGKPAESWRHFNGRPLGSFFVMRIWEDLASGRTSRARSGSVLKLHQSVKATFLYGESIILWRSIPW